MARSSGVGTPPDDSPRGEHPTTRPAATSGRAGRRRRARRVVARPAGAVGGVSPARRTRPPLRAGASVAPRQKWIPIPNDSIRPTLRVLLSRSRLAAASIMTTSVPRTQFTHSAERISAKTVPLEIKDWAMDVEWRTTGARDNVGGGAVSCQRPSCSCSVGIVTRLCAPVGGGLTVVACGEDATARSVRCSGPCLYPS